MFESTRRANWHLLVAFLFLHSALTWWVNAYGFGRNMLNSTLEANLLLLAVVVVGLLFGVGRLRPKDVGLGSAQMVPALLGGLVFWVALQFVAGLFSFMSGGVVLEPSWQTEGWKTVVSELASQLFGNALYEEIVFRGFFLVQLGLLVQNYISPRWLSTALALFVSQAIFAPGHLPNRLFVEQMTLSESFSSLESVFIAGILFALLYLRTRNLLLVVAVHALINAPTGIFAASEEVLGYTWLGLGVLFILFWKPNSPRAASTVTAQP